MGYKLTRRRAKSAGLGTFSVDRLRKHDLASSMRTIIKYLQKSSNKLVVYKVLYKYFFTKILYDTGRINFGRRSLMTIYFSRNHLRTT